MWRRVSALGSENPSLSPTSSGVSGGKGESRSHVSLPIQPVPPRGVVEEQGDRAGGVAGRGDDHDLFVAEQHDVAIT